MSSINLQFLLKNNIFRKIYILIVLLFTSLFISALFGETFYFCCKSQNKIIHFPTSSNPENGSSLDKVEGLTNYGGVSVPDSRSSLEDVLSSNNSSIVQVANIKNILLDTKVGTKDNLTKMDSLYYDQISQLFTEVNDSTISSEKQLLNIQSIMKQVNPALRIPGNNKN